MRTMFCIVSKNQLHSITSLAKDARDAAGNMAIREKGTLHLSIL